LEVDSVSTVCGFWWTLVDGLKARVHFFLCLLCAMSSPLQSRRQQLRQQIEIVKAGLEELRRTEKVHLQRLDRRRRKAIGYGYTGTFVTLQLIYRIAADEAMLSAVSKLLLPPSIWSHVGKPEGWLWRTELQRLLRRPRVQNRADAVWANRVAPMYRRIMRRAKRLVAEYRVFAQAVALNRRGVTPKRVTLVHWLKAFWPYSDVGTDVLPNNVDVDRKAKRWAQGFRRRWNVKWSKLKVRGNMTPAEQTTKALPFRAEFVSILGPKIETSFWTHFLVPPVFFNTVGPVLGSIFGAGFGPLVEWVRIGQSGARIPAVDTVALEQTISR